MSDHPVFVAGTGAVSPAGWDMTAFRQALFRNAPLPPCPVSRPGWEKSLAVRKAPPPSTRPPFLAHARLRRSSPISQFAVAAALEALGDDAQPAANNNHLGIVLCAMSGCVNYSRRFYDETLRDPATASPLVFPETVFNAPASHLAALLQTSAINYTVVGDGSAFLEGLAIAADWVGGGRVETALVVGSEESDWLTADAFRHFSRDVIMAEGAGALYLSRRPSGQSPVELRAITDPHIYLRGRSPREAVLRMKRQLPRGTSDDLLCDGLRGLPALDSAERSAWDDWPGARLSPKFILGEGMIAAAAWQCVAAVDALRRGLHRRANVSVAGTNTQAIGAHFALSQSASKTSNAGQ